MKVQRDGMTKVWIGVLHQTEEGKGRIRKTEANLGQIEVVNKKRALLKN